mmetsp:Transcript_12112/g.25645  ORF Transcript_12112/g.25645 Transcript_12112/m.25645 type:complete len:101 (-) Transcript_12112:434-736(-)
MDETTMSNEEGNAIPLGATPAHLIVDSSTTVPSSSVRKRNVKSSEGSHSGTDEQELHISKAYAEIAKANGVRYTVTDVPPLGLSTLLAFSIILPCLGQRS